MREERIEFYSEGCKLRGFLRLPDELPAEPLPAVVQGPGWLGLIEANAYVPWHEGLTAAGIAVLGFDYRGFGDSEGERGWVRPEWQVEDWLNAVTYLETRPEVHPRRIGAFGVGGTGGANAVMAASLDARIKAVAVQSVVADGAAWLRNMRREYEWVETLRRVEADRRRWVLEGTGEKVDPREELMVQTPERKRVQHKADVDSKIDPRFYLRTAEYVMRMRPIDHVQRISPRALLLTSVEDDTVTPEDHALALYEKAGPPKKLIRQTETEHYLSYTVNRPVLLPQIVDWYQRYLAYSTVMSRETTLEEEVVWLR